MREILFRGKRIDNGEWVEGYLVPITINCYDKGYEIIESDGIEYDELDGYNPLFSSFRVYPETVGQYTGLTDKNGKRIFEGDIVIFKTTNYHFEPCVVEYHNDVAQFVVSKNGRSYPMADDFSYEVIGNIHDNPELIGGKEDATV